MPKMPVNHLSIADLLAEVKQRRRKLPRLNRLAAKLQKKLEAVRAEIEKLGGEIVAKTGSRRRAQKRPRNKITLADAIAKVLDTKKPLSVPQIAVAVRKAGYKTSSKTFTTIIYQTLAKDKRVKKAKRGQYVLKGQ